MVSSKKRGRQEMEAVEHPKELTLLDRIRNMWQFANLAQWIFIFGKVVKIDENVDVEELETECLKPNSTVLSDIGLALLKFVSSHRGLTPEIFDEYTRRQYVAKAPDRNPFGTDEVPAKFGDFDIFTKIRVLQQLTQWTMGNPDRIRERMEEHKDSDQTYWRVEPFGWDSDDRTYFVLDDNRLYRQTEPPPPPAPTPAPKKNSKKAKAALRASKRRKVSEPAISEEEIINDHAGGDKESPQVEDDGLGGAKWECIAVTLDDLNNFLVSIERSRDPNEKVLRKRIIDDLLPLLERQEEARKRKAAQKERELVNLEKLATAKRSSRIAGKLEQQRQEEEAREAERKRQAELVMAKREREKWMKLERERESRMMTREQRLREREARRILHEEELANLSEDSKKLESGQSRLSERHLKAEIERKKQALEELAEEDDWVFDCICGAYGQVDDGTHSISCEKCNIWQHTKCVGVSEAEADGDDFHFICKTCKRRVEEAQKAKHRPTIKLKLNRPSAPSAAPNHETNGSPLGTPTHVGNGSSGLAISPHKSSPFYQASLPKSNYDSPYGKGGFGSIQVQISSANHSTTTTPSQAKENSSNLSYSPHINGSSAARPLHSPTFHLKGQSTSPLLDHRTPAVPRPTNQERQQANGYTSQSVSGSHSTATDSHINTPVVSNPFSHPALQATSSGRYSILPVPAQGVQNRVHADQLRQSPTITPSPLAGAPTLTPYADKSSIFASPLSPNLRSTTTQQCSQMTTVQPGSSPTNLPQSSNLEAAHEYALPPAVSGISPIKHSPPRPTTANSVTSLGTTTPSLLPPIAPLSPSSQQPDLTSPVKPATPRGIS